MRDIGKGPWRSGPPPSVGWWPADDITLKSRHALRWWDGQTWSVAAWRGVKYSTKALNDIAAQYSSWSNTIVWRDRADWWPARSRT